MNTVVKDALAPEQRQALLTTLEIRFNKHMRRHPGLGWDRVKAELEAAPGKLWSLYQMEESGGEPDVVAGPDDGSEILFYDCAAESPKGRRSLCYDDDALAARKEHAPNDSVIAVAASMGVELLDEARYRALQEWGPFDTKTSSWILTPDTIRRHGGALFGDYRYGHTFVYHNGAQSYYAARGFRALLRLQETSLARSSGIDFVIVLNTEPAAIRSGSRLPRS